MCAWREEGNAKVSVAKNDIEEQSRTGYVKPLIKLI